MKHFSSETDDLNLLLIHQAQAGSLEACQRLFERNLGLVHFITNRYKESGLEYEDLFSHASMGFLRALQTYDPEKSGFTTYFTLCMQNEIRKALRHFNSQSSWLERKALRLDADYELDEDGVPFIEMLGYEDPDFGRLEDLDALQFALAHFKQIASNLELRALELFLQQELSQREMSQLLGISQSYASRVLSRIFRTLRYLIDLEDVPKSRLKGVRKEDKKEDKKGVLDVMRKRVNTGHLKYLFEHTTLSNTEIGKIVGCSHVAVFRYRSIFDRGQLSVDEDVSVIPLVQAYLSSLDSENRSKVEKKLSRVFFTDTASAQAPTQDGAKEERKTDLSKESGAVSDTAPLTRGSKIQPHSIPAQSKGVLSVDRSTKFPSKLLPKKAPNEGDTAPKASKTTKTPVKLVDQKAKTKPTATQTQKPAQTPTSQPVEPKSSKEIVQPEDLLTVYHQPAPAQTKTQTKAQTKTQTGGTRVTTENPENPTPKPSVSGLTNLSFSLNQVSLEDLLIFLQGLKGTLVPDGRFDVKVSFDLSG